MQELRICPASDQARGYSDIPWIWTPRPAGSVFDELWT